MSKARVKFAVSSQAIQALTAKIIDLDRKVARTAIRKGLTEASKVVMWDAKKNVPKRSGQLRKSIGRKIWIKKGGATVAAIIGPRKGFRVMYLGKPINPVKYAHLVEFGRREVVAGTAKGRPTGKKVLSSGKEGGQVFGKKVRSVAPHPFMRPAWENNQERVVALIVRELENGIKSFYARRVRFRDATGKGNR